MYISNEAVWQVSHVAIEDVLRVHDADCTLDISGVELNCTFAGHQMFTHMNATNEDVMCGLLLRARTGGLQRVPRAPQSFLRQRPLRPSADPHPFAVGAHGERRSQL